MRYALVFAIFYHGRSAIFHICPESRDAIFLMRSQRNACAFLKHHAQIFQGTLINFRIFYFLALPYDVRISQGERWEPTLHNSVSCYGHLQYGKLGTETRAWDQGKAYSRWPTVYSSGTIPRVQFEKKKRRYLSAWRKYQ